MAQSVDQKTVGTMRVDIEKEWITDKIIPELESSAARFFDLAFDELRKSIMRWPPVVDQTEEEGIATIRAFVLNGFTTMVRESGILSKLSEDRMMAVESGILTNDRLVQLIDARVQQLKQGLLADELRKLCRTK